MRDLLKFIVGAVAIGGIVGVAHGAQPTGRAGYNTITRMPSMPAMPISVGNLTPNLPADNTNDGNGNGGVTPPPPPPPPVPECPDGGVANSEYTTANCMNELLGCINSGALPGGLNDLFDVAVRRDIFAGMNLCRAGVDRCISTVRVNCENVYDTPADVWAEFDIQKIQPEYYNFVLRKTGLTPNQAENTCWLLDKNTYGAAFSAVANSGATTVEYNNAVGAYNNSMGGVLVKSNPMGATVNNGNPGVDGARGHYARWNATTGECLVRVAAYNKDDHITNSWLFGAAGNDMPAEVWEPAGGMFTCNRDLFGFSLMTNTNTAAVVGIGGGTLVGAGIGAIAGHGDRAFDCGNAKHRAVLTQQLRATGKISALNGFLGGVAIPAFGADVDAMQCAAIVQLYNDKMTTSVACGGMTVDYTIAVEEGETWEQLRLVGDMPADIVARVDVAVNAYQVANPNARAYDVARFANDEIQRIVAEENAECTNADRELANIFAALPIIREGEDSNMLKSTLIGAGTGAAAGGLATAITAFVEKGNINCRVGDNLEKVGYNKSHQIGSLKDFYVKWNLRLPE